MAAREAKAITCLLAGPRCYQLAVNHRLGRYQPATSWVSNSELAAELPALPVRLQHAKGW
jgi:hypothetical protein